MNHLSEEQLILYYYGEADEADAIKTHLSFCPHCRSNYESFQRVFAAVDAMEVPARGENYGQEVWQRIKPRLGKPRVFLWSFPVRPPRWAVAGAMAALVAAAFLLGRFWQAPQVSTPPSPPGQVRERVLLATVGDHLERSQRFLTELLNTAANGGVNISTQQDVAEELLAANRLYRLSAERAGEIGMASVLEDLERELLEIAHSPSQLTSSELDQIRRRVDEQGLLFKVRVIGTRVRERERAAAREMARRIL